MAKLAPKWAKNAVATTRGWVVNGELVKAQKMTQEQVDQINGVTPVVEQPVTIVPHVVESAPILEITPSPILETQVEEQG